MTGGSASGGRAVPGKKKGKRKRPSQRRESPLERELELQLKASRMNGWAREVMLIPGRKLRCDFVWDREWLVVEIEGGVFTRGRHTRGKGFEDDCEKYALLMCMGWRVLRVTGGQVKSGKALEWIRGLLAQPIRG